MEIHVRHIRTFGWVADIDPPSAGPVILFIWEGPGLDGGQERAIQCTRLRWNARTGGIEVQGRLLHRYDGFRPRVTRNGEPVIRTMHLRQVLDVFDPEP